LSKNWSSVTIWPIFTKKKIVPHIILFYFSCLEYLHPYPPLGHVVVFITSNMVYNYSQLPPINKQIGQDKVIRWYYLNLITLQFAFYKHWSFHTFIGTNWHINVVHFNQNILCMPLVELLLWMEIGKKVVPMWCWMWWTLLESQRGGMKVELLKKNLKMFWRVLFAILLLILVLIQWSNP
jgi:hypothetical protein